MVKSIIIEKACMDTIGKPSDLLVSWIEHIMPYILDENDIVNEAQALSIYITKEEIESLDEEKLMAIHNQYSLSDTINKRECFQYGMEIIFSELSSLNATVQEASEACMDCDTMALLISAIMYPGKPETIKKMAKKIMEKNHENVHRRNRFRKNL